MSQCGEKKNSVTVIWKIEVGDSAKCPITHKLASHKSNTTLDISIANVLLQVHIKYISDMSAYQRMGNEEKGKERAS